MKGADVSAPLFLLCHKRRISLDSVSGGFRFRISAVGEPSSAEIRLSGSFLRLLRAFASSLASELVRSSAFIYFAAFTKA